MSLLLDALKKAADDKQKAEKGDSAEGDTAPIIHDEKDTPNSDELKKTAVQKNQGEEAFDDSNELTLEIDETVSEPQNEDELTLEETVTHQPQQDKTVEILPQSTEPQPAQTKPETSNAQFKISDDGLSLLIHKTNKDVKKSRNMLLAGVFLLSLIVVSLSGGFYYFDMQDEIASIERKHYLTMRAMQSKTGANTTPEHEIVRKLVGDGDIDDKVKFAKAQITNSRVENKKQITRAAVEKEPLVKPSGLTIRKTQITDPVEDTLNDAWQAYEAGRYDDAKRSYSKVLSIENKNRDALLGLGAIAIIEKDKVGARQVYGALLKLDPRDPIATAALASLKENTDSHEEEQSYLKAMLEKAPEAHELNFALGNSYAGQNKWKLAQQSYFAAWQADSENANYIFNLAVSMDQLNKPEQALAFYKDSLTKAGDKPVSFSRQAVKQRITELTGL